MDATRSCQACVAAEKNPLSGLYQGDCPECQARALSQSPAFWASMAARKFRADYADALRQIAGPDPHAREELHRKVRDWERRIDDAREVAQ